MKVACIILTIIAVALACACACADVYMTSRQKVVKPRSSVHTEAVERVVISGGKRHDPNDESEYAAYTNAPEHVKRNLSPLVIRRFEARRRDDESKKRMDGIHPPAPVSPVERREQMRRIAKERKTRRPTNGEILATRRRFSPPKSNFKMGAKVITEGGN